PDAERDEVDRANHDPRLSLDAMDGEKKKPKFSIGYIILAFWAVLLAQQLFSAYVQPGRLSYSDFKAAVAADKGQEVVGGQTTIRGRSRAEPPPASPAPPSSAAPPAEPPAAAPPAEAPKTGTGAGAGAQNRPFETVRVDDPDLMRDLAKHGVRVVGTVEST